MDQSSTPNSAGFQPKSSTAAAAVDGATPSASRGWRDALAGVFGCGNSAVPESPTAAQSGDDAAPDGRSSVATTPTSTLAPGKLSANGGELRQICELIGTPLGGLLGMADLVSAGGLTTTQAQYVSVIRTSVAEALSTLEDLTELASEDQRFVEPVRRPFTASQIIDPLALEFGPHYHSRQLTLSCKNSFAVDARLEGDLTRITNLVRRILRIAVRHNEHAALELSLSAAARTAAAAAVPHSANNITANTVTAQITVGDFRIGLSTERADRILRGTPRADDLWAQDGQTGLTLRACRVTVTALGGTLVIASAGNGLSRVLISVPVGMSVGSLTNTATDTATGTASATVLAAISKPAHASTGAPALIDIEALIARCVNNKAVAAAVLESLARMLPEKLASLREAVESLNSEKVRVIAHTIKGSAANAAVDAVRSKALQIELMAKAADFDGITGALPALGKIISSVLIEIPQTRASLIAPTTKAAA